PHVGDGDSSERDLDWAGFQEADVDGHSLTINWDINPDLSLVSISALRNMETDGSTDADG
ncbi:MAG: hypothetical protein GWN58_17935, partial [Anaerolineae bacterium]|nr:hypothetical protein [Anaerolineae bacterium]